MTIALLAVTASWSCGGTATTSDGTRPPACESPAEALAFPSRFEADFFPARDEYPGRFFCVEVPAGLERLEVALSGLASNFDLYVGATGLDLVPGHEVFDHQWSSREVGTSDEVIVIAAPEPGLYYIEVHSFARTESSFVLTVGD